MTDRCEPDEFFEEPDEIRVTQESLCCFLDPTRVCGPDCTAYVVDPPSHNPNNKWVRCMPLLHLHRVTKIFDRMLGVIQNSAADAKRAGASPYPAVDPVTGRVL